MLKTCSICGRISGTDGNHLDCIQMRKIILEDEVFKQTITERMDANGNSGGLGVEIRAVLEHMTREREGGSKPPDQPKRPPLDS